MDNAPSSSNVREGKISYLIDAYGTALSRICYLYLRDVSLAEDAVQDTYIKAYQKLDDFDPQNDWSEKAWLTRIAVNTCKDYRKSAWFQRVDRRVDPSDIPQAATMDKEELRLLEDVMELPAKLKVAVLLYYYLDMSVKEIMSTLGISQSTVYQRLDRAQKKLKTKLERGYDDD